jgi:hypothetical protein
MVIMLTYRCSLDCDHCLIYKTGPRGEHMSHWILECSMKLFEKTRSNQLGIAGGEPLEHPDFWNILADIRKKALRKGFSVKVATSGEPIDKDPSLIDRIASSAPVMFQITRTPPFYPPLEQSSALRELSNVYFYRLSHFYKSKKSQERGFKNHTAMIRERPYCEPAYRLAKHVSLSMDFGSFIRQWEGYQDVCTIHVHPDGSIRLGPIDNCRKVGHVVTMIEDFRKEGRHAMALMGANPCRACGMKGKVR